MTRLVLTHGEDRLELDRCGGMVMAWHRDIQPLLRQSTAEAPLDPLSSAGFPLLPYSNRIGHGQFTWAGETIKLSPNFAPEPHAIHGVGWTRTWQIIAQSDSHATFALEHSPNADWPWPFTAEQDFRLDADGLTLTLRLRNLADIAVPAGLGHHPYFDAPGASLRFAAETVLLSDPDQLPADTQPPFGIFDFSDGAPVSGRQIDHCYQGWDGAARIEWAGRRWALDITASPALRCAVVYIAASGDVFCFEPVSHANNAINRPALAPMATLAPEETLVAQIRYAVVPAAD